MRSFAAFVVAAAVICSASGSVIPVKKLQDGIWWNSTLMYQIEIGSWYDSDGDGWGDFEGISQYVNHFTTLGVKAVFLSPVFDESDWTKVNPNFGNMTTFRALLTKFSDSEIRVVLDIEPTATSYNHPWFQDALMDGPKHQWYIWQIDKTPGQKTNWVPLLGGANGDVWKPAIGHRANDFYLQFFDGPELDFTNSQVVTEIQEVFKVWAHEAVDGFRIRHASYLVETFENEDSIPNCISPNNYDCYKHDYTTNTDATYQVFSKLAGAATSIRKNLTIFVEPYLQNNYTLGTKFLQNGAHAIISPVLTNFTMATTSTTMNNVIPKWMNQDSGQHIWMFGNRDTSRKASRMGPDGQDGATMLSALIPGTYLMYYGDEIGMTDIDGFALNGMQPAQRTGFQWNNGFNGGFTNFSMPPPLVNPNYWRVNFEDQRQNDKSRYSLVKDLMKIRTHAADYNFTIYDINNLTFAFSRSSGDSLYFVIVNTDNMDESYNLTSLQLPYTSMNVEASSLNSEIKTGDSVDLGKFSMRPMSSLVLSTGANSSVIAQFSLSLILMCLAFLRLNF